MSAHTSDSIDAALLTVDVASRGSDAIHSNVLALFDRCAPSLLRYVASFGLSVEETEDVVQDVFVALFRHLSLGRAQTNLPGWLFQVAHNHALKRRERILRQLRSADPNEAAVQWCVDPTPDPERQLMWRERGKRLRAVFDALPERDRRCLFLRSEGMTYRDIATTLSVSLGSVAKAVSRALTRLMNADGG